MFYNGPVDKISPDHPKDFISLELRDGYPVLYINHGTGTLKLQLDGKGKDGITRMKGLDDGTWRRIDLIRNGQVRIVFISDVLFFLNTAEFRIQLNKKNNPNIFLEIFLLDVILHKKM